VRSALADQAGCARSLTSISVSEANEPEQAGIEALLRLSGSVTGVAEPAESEDEEEDDQNDGPQRHGVSFA
jgi:hypothetical protein